MTTETHTTDLKSTVLGGRGQTQRLNTDSVHSHDSRKGAKRRRQDTDQDCPGMGWETDGTGAGELTEMTGI